MLVSTSERSVALAMTRSFLVHEKSGDGRPEAAQVSVMEGTPNNTRTSTGALVIAGLTPQNTADWSSSSRNSRRGLMAVLTMSMVVLEPRLVVLTDWIMGISGEMSSCSREPWEQPVPVV